jgi:TATA-binding protein-associated factor
MPGYLGSRDTFERQIARPLARAAAWNATEADAAQGSAALASLHRRLLPLVMRRLKGDVLQDLPPKVIQDIACDLTPQQARLYAAASPGWPSDAVILGAASTVLSCENDDDSNVTDAGPTNTFKVFRELRAICNHPALAQRQTASLGEPDDASSNQSPSLSLLFDWKLSGKLVALRELILESDIGTDDTEQNPDSASATQTLASVESSAVRKMLIFSQTRAGLDIIEHGLLRPVFSNVKYSRLDGSVPSSRRVAVAEGFNKDPSLSILLLTTHIGGLGLNLASASTVVFLDHDFNPAVDLQVRVSHFLPTLTIITP